MQHSQHNPTRNSSRIGDQEMTIDHAPTPSQVAIAPQPTQPRTPAALILGAVLASLGLVLTGFAGILALSSLRTAQLRGLRHTERALPGEQPRPHPGEPRRDHRTRLARAGPGPRPEIGRAS